MADFAKEQALAAGITNCIGILFSGNQFTHLAGSATLGSDISLMSYML